MTILLMNYVWKKARKIYTNVGLGIGSQGLIFVENNTQETWKKNILKMKIGQFYRYGKIEKSSSEEKAKSVNLGETR